MPHSLNFYIYDMSYIKNYIPHILHILALHQTYLAANLAVSKWLPGASWETGTAA